MPEEVKPKTFSFDQKAWDAKITRLQDLRDKYAGKQGYNPFIWFSTNVMPLIIAHKMGDRSQKLFNDLMAVKEEIVRIIPEEKTTK